MKKNYTKFLFATMMLLISSVGFAQTTFYIEPFSIAAGETKVIPVLMENPDDTFSQLQFDITLPEGLEIPEYSNGFRYVKDIKHGSRTLQEFYSIQTRSVDGALRVLCTTQDAYAFFIGESGDVLLIAVKAADDITIGDVEIKITNTVLSRQDGTTYKPSDCTAAVSVTDATGINVVGADGDNFVVYTLGGVKVLETTDINKVTTLPTGFYLVNGKQVFIK